MKISHQKEIVKIEEILDDIICNKCGESCNISTNKEKPEYYGLCEISYSGGYGSTALRDGCNYTFSVCEKCLKEFFDSCKIKPFITSFLKFPTFDEYP